MTVARGECLLQLRPVDVADADRSYLAGLDQLVEGAQRLLDRRLGVRLVRQVHVDALRSEPREAAFDLAEDPVARKSAIVWVAGDGPEDLRAEQDG